MVEEEAVLRVQRCDRLHVVLIKLKIENAEVLDHALLTNRLGNCHHAALRQPAQDDLSHAFTVFFGDGEQNVVVENVVFTLGERTPGFDLDVVFCQEFLGFDLLMEGMRFDLVNCRNHFAMNNQVYKPIGLEVADTNRSNPPSRYNSSIARQEP